MKYTLSIDLLITPNRQSPKTPGLPTFSENEGIQGQPGGSIISSTPRTRLFPWPPSPLPPPSNIGNDWEEGGGGEIHAGGLRCYRSALEEGYTVGIDLPGLRPSRESLGE